MDIDKKDIAALAGMSDEEFIKKIGHALKNAGANGDVMKRFSENAPLLKKTLSTLSPGEAESLIRQIDPEALEKIRKSFESR